MVFPFPLSIISKLFVSMKNRVRDHFRTSGNCGVPSGCPMITKNFLRSYGTPQDPNAKFQPDPIRWEFWKYMAYD